MYSNVFEVVRDESHGGDKPGGGVGGTFGPAELFEQSVRGAEDSQADSIRVDG